MKHIRKRYQHGSLTTEKRKDGTKVRVYRWREPPSNGGQGHRKIVVGTKREYPTKAAALEAVAGLQLDVNAGSATPVTITVAQLISHYKETELTDADKKTQRCKDVYRYQLDKVIAPVWGAYLLRDVKPIAVERWLNGSPGAPSTNTKCAFSVLFQHAMRYEWPASNPIRVVRQGAMPQREQIVLTKAEVAAILSELRGAFYAIVATASITGLRRGELFGLKWQDIDFLKGEIR